MKNRKNMSLYKKTLLSSISFGIVWGICPLIEYIKDQIIGNSILLICVNIVYIGVLIFGTLSLIYTLSTKVEKEDELATQNFGKAARVSLSTIQLILLVLVLSYDIFGGNIVLTSDMLKYILALILVLPGITFLIYEKIGEY